jgi:[ribosomal protein S5]-alanine N-acetyltransferase
MRRVLTRCELRSWALEDIPALARWANAHAVWRNLRDGFPSPYTEEHARAWVNHSLITLPETNFAIAVDGETVGAVGATLGTDVARRSAEVGYWLAEPFWGRGICTEAVRAFTADIVTRLDLVRVFALPFARNAASARVLEKAGYRLEGTMRRAVVKEGEVLDQLLYAFVPGLD